MREQELRDIIATIREIGRALDWIEEEDPRRTEYVGQQRECLSLLQNETRVMV